jgi:hypothetical protein
MEPLQRHQYTELSTFHPLKIHLSLRVPSKGFPTMFPNRVLMDRDTPSPEPLVYSFIHSFMYVCQSPQKGAILHMGKNIRSPSTEPHTDGRPTYNGVWPGSPRGSLTTLLSLPQCRAALGTILSTLTWVDQSPISQHVIANPVRVYTPQLLPPPS